MRMLTLVIFKGCGRCKGDLVLDDEGEPFCIQCGRYKDGVIAVPLSNPRVSRVKTPVRKLPGGRQNKTIDELKWPDGVKSWKW